MSKALPNVDAHHPPAVPSLWRVRLPCQQRHRSGQYCVAPVSSASRSATAGGYRATPSADLSAVSRSGLSSPICGL